MSVSRAFAVCAIRPWLLPGLLMCAFSSLVLAQDQSAPPPPPGGPGTMVFQGPGVGGGFFLHEEIGEGRKVVTGAPMTAVLTTTRDTALADGNTIHTEGQTTVYRDSEGRVRREVQFELATPATGATKRTMVVITDPVSGYRYMLNAQNKVAHQMPLRPPKPAGSAGRMHEPEWKSGGSNVTTEQLGAKTILGLQAQGTRVTRTIPAGQIGNAKPILVVTERWESTDLQIPLSMTHTDPMMGTVTAKVTSVNRAEPDPSLFQVPADYKVKAGKPGDMLYMPAKP
ncbi:MAG TPA: hypothetical protein VL240_07070 [Candidatus Binatia bacterium]|nr:hypothetical protein [Candidatus Binatia bacterium]